MNQIHRQQTLRGKSKLYCLVAALAVFVNLLILGCGDIGSVFLSFFDANRSGVEAHILVDGPSTYKPGDTVHLKLTGDWDGTQKNMIVWYPPPAANVTFGTLQPEPGGPPYYFMDVPKSWAIAGLDVSYTIPLDALVDNPYGDTYHSVTVYDGDKEDSAMVKIYVEANNPAPPRVESPQRPATSDTKSTLALQATSSVWRIQDGHTIDTTFNQSTCQDIAEQIGTGNAFMAWRFPLADQIVPGTSYRLPIVQNADPAVPFHLLLISGALYRELPLIIDPVSSSWANENLPTAPGEMWVAMRVKPGATLDCPVMGNQPSVTVVADFTLDLSARPGACANCVLTSYACYKTGSGSLPLSGPAARLAAAAAGSLSADGVTCLGPSQRQLTDNNKTWMFEPFTISQLLKPGDPIAIHYWVDNLSATNPLTLNLAPSPNLPGASWVIRPGLTGNPDQPDPDQTVGSSIIVPASGSFHLHILSTVPAGAVPGDYQYALTLSNPSASPASWKGNTALKVTADGTLPGPAEPAAGVSLGGQAGAPLAQPGKNLIYYLSIENTGATPLTNLVLTGALPAGTTFVSCGGGDNCQVDGSQVTWNLASLEIGYTHVMTLVVTVGAELEPGTILRNTTYSVQTGQGVSAIGAEIDTPVAFLMSLPRISKP